MKTKPHTCEKCGTEESPSRVLWASVDLCATICGPCHDEFDAWADANRGRFYSDFMTLSSVA